MDDFLPDFFRQAMRPVANASETAPPDMRLDVTPEQILRRLTTPVLLVRGAGEHQDTCCYAGSGQCKWPRRRWLRSQIASSPASHLITVD